MIRTKWPPATGERATVEAVDERHQDRRQHRGDGQGDGDLGHQGDEEQCECQDTGDSERQPGADPEVSEPAGGLTPGDPSLSRGGDTPRAGGILGTGSPRELLHDPKSGIRVWHAGCPPGERSARWRAVRSMPGPPHLLRRRVVVAVDGPPERPDHPRAREPRPPAVRLTLERLREVLTEDHAGRERERSGERGGELEHAVLALGQQREPSVDVESRQQWHDRGDHHDQRRDPEPSGDEVADGPDGDGRDGRAPGPADLRPGRRPADPLSERRRPGATATSERSGAYDANAKAAAARAAPSTVTPASARPAAPGLREFRPTPSRSPTVSPAPTPAMMPAVFSTASISRALAVTGKPVRASWVAPMTSSNRATSGAISWSPPRRALMDSWVPTRSATSDS